MKIPAKIISILTISVLVCESVVMLILHLTDTHNGHISLVLIDSFALVFFLSPILYIFVYKPLNYQVEKLKEQDNKYRALIEETEDLITHVNREGRFTFVNSASTKILGLSPEECIGLVAFDFIHPEDQARTRNWFEECVAGKRKRGRIENRQINRTTGDSHSVLWSTSFEYDDADTFIGVGGIARDLSPIRSAEQKYQNLFEQMLDGFALHEMIYDAEGVPIDYRFLQINPAFENQSGLKSEDLIGRTVLEAMPGLEKDWIKIYGQVVLTGEPESFENYSKDLDKYFKVTAFRPAKNQFACIFRDITERKRAEVALIEEKNKLEAVVAALGDGLTVQDRNFKIVFQNEIQKERQGEHEGEYCYKAYQGRSTVCEGCSVVKCFADGQVHKRETSSHNREGHEIHMEVSASPIKDSAGNIIGAVETVRDITQRRLLQTQLQHSHKMEAIGTLAGGIAHDFNNLLTIIMGYANLIKEDAGPGSSISLSVDAVLEAGSRAVEMVQQILTFSRQTEQTSGPVQIDQVVKETLNLLCSTLPSSIEVKHDIDSKSGFVNSDAGKINQIVMNLCTNAYHAMQKSGGCLIVILRPIQINYGDEIQREIFDFKPGAYVELTVIDNGPGIEKATLERIFDPFFSTKGKGEGTGLGLSVVHGIVKGHGGQINVSSEPGLGTKFHVYLPQMTEQAVLKAEEHQEEAFAVPLEGSERIMVVDDETKLATLEKMILETLGYCVEVFFNSNEALQAFKKRPADFDLIITDMTMPGLNGLKLSEEISRISPTIPIILCTGYSDLIDKGEAGEFGIKKFLTKPVGKEELAKAIREVLDDLPT